MPSTELSRSSRVLLTRIFTRSSSPAPARPSVSLRDLMGKQFAFGDINSASARLIPLSRTHAGRTQSRNRSQASLQRQPSCDRSIWWKSEWSTPESGSETIFNFLIAAENWTAKKSAFFIPLNPFVRYVYVARKDVPEAERERFARALLALKEGKDDPVLKILRARNLSSPTTKNTPSIRQIAHELKCSEPPAGFAHRRFRDSEQHCRSGALIRRRRRRRPAFFARYVRRDRACRDRRSRNNPSELAARGR